MRTLFVALLALLPVTTAAFAAPTMPKDVERCIAKQHMWIAAPRYFERFDFTHEDGRKERAWQIHDRHAGADGFLLLFPKTCRLVVLAQKKSTHPIARNSYVSAPPNAPPTAQETAVLYRWAGAVPYDADDPSHAAVAALDTLERWPKYQEHHKTLHVGSHTIETQPKRGTPALPKRLWQTTPVDGFNRILDFSRLKRVPSGNLRVDVHVTEGSDPIALVAIRSADDQTHRWVGAWRVDGPPDLHVAVDRLWLVARQSGQPRVVTIPLDGDTIHTVAFRTDQKNVRVGLTETGVSVGLFHEVGRTYPWREMTRVLRNQN